LILFVPLIIVATTFAQIDPCHLPPGEYRTQTQGGWGETCHGGNPGCILDNNFAAVYPSGITVGGGFTMHFSSSAAVQAYLPAGGTPSVLTANLNDPTSSPAGVFGGQVLSLAINVAFSDAAVSGFPSGLGNLVIGSGLGPFSGWTVYQILALSNQVLGGDLSGLPNGTSISNLNAAADSINNNFDDGTTSKDNLVDADCDDPLPVELTSFDAIAGENSIMVVWRTASESRIDYYEVDRKYGASDWRALGSVNGLGDSPTGHHYSFTDETAAAGVTYSYRLIIHGVDGSEVVHSQIASATIQPAAAPGEFALYQNYPNPFNPTTTISFNIGENSIVRLSVFDLLGREVAVLVNGQMNSGAFTVTFDASQMAGGVYFYRLEAGSFTAVRRLMLLK